MALIVQQDIPYDHPTEKDAGGAPARFVLRLPLKVRSFEAIDPGRVGNQFSVNIALIKAALVSWPYGEITEEAVGDLDIDTFKWLVEAINERSGITDEAKNGSGASSLPSMDPGVAPSPIPSGTY